MKRDLLRSSSVSPWDMLLHFTSGEGAESSEEFANFAFVNGFLCYWLNFVDICGRNDISHRLYKKTGQAAPFISLLSTVTENCALQNPT